MLQAEADYFGMSPPRTDFGELKESEFILRAAKMEEMITENTAFSDQTMTDGLVSDKTSVYTYIY